MSERRLFASGTSVLWVVRRDGDRREARYVLKELQSGKGPSSTAYRRFVREIRIVRSLHNRHDGIVPIEDAALPESGDEKPYIVMPMAESTLAKMTLPLSGGAGLERLLMIGIRVAEALSVAHEMRVVHRDIKPENILLFGDGQDPRVADFGISHLADDEDRLTAHDARAIGSRGFTAPELETGGRIESVLPTVDVYALGKTLYKVASGGRVLPREDVEGDYDLAVRLGDPRMAHIMDLVARMVARRPEDRYQSMTECADHMKRAVQNLRLGIPFAPGMYGGADTAAERVERLRRTLETTLDRVRLADTIDDAVRSSLSSASRTAIEAGERKGILGGPVGEPRPQAADAAARAADELMSVGLPLTLHGDRDLFEVWMAPIRSGVDQAKFAETLGEMQILPAAAVFAVYGVAAMAWHRRRFGILRPVLEAVRRGAGWVYLDALGESSRPLGQWTVRALNASAALARVRPSHWDTEAAIAAVSGLTILSELATGQELDEWTNTGRGAPTRYWLPGYFNPLARWTQDLPTLFSKDSGLERRVAQELFDLSPDEFRAMARRLGAVVGRALTNAREGSGSSIRWVQGPGPAWERWVGEGA